MAKKAIIALNEGSMTNGIVENLIEISSDAAIGLQLPKNRILWSCDNYPVTIGDEWNDGVFTRNGEPVYPIPTAEQRIYELEAELESTNAQLINTQMALCDVYESNLILQEMIKGGV